MASDKPTINPDQPLDDIVTMKMETIARKGRGFVLDLVKDVNGKDASVEIEVKESLPQHDEYLRPSDYRSHILHDTGSFIAYAKRYGDPTKSLVFYDEKLFACVIEEQIDKGENREVITMPVTMADDWKDWSGIINKPMDHKQMLNFLLRHEHNLQDPAMLVAMASFRLNMTVVADSDVSENQNTLGIMVKTTAGEETKKFPKKFSVNIPVLESDVNADQLTVCELRLNIQIPQDAKDPAKFTFFCSKWNQTVVTRIEQEGQMVRDGLSGFTVIHGEFANKKKKTGEV